MKKICHITTCHGAEDNRIFNRECKALAEQYDVTLIYPGNDSYKKDGVKIIGVNKRTVWNRLWLLFRQLAFLDCKPFYRKALELDCDIYHFHDPDFLFYGKKLKKLGKIVIFDSHENYPEQLKVYLGHWPGFIGRIYSSFYKFYEDIVFRIIDAVIFPATKEGKHPFEGRCKRTIVCNNLPKMEDYYDRYEDTYECREKKVCYIGSLTSARGVEQVIKASYRAAADLILAGKFYEDSFRKEMESLKEYERTDYRGFVNVLEACSIGNSSRIGLATVLNVGQYNQYDNLATKAYEYMSLGLPIILTNSKYNSGFIEKYKCGICVDPTDIDEYSKAITYLLENTDEACEMGKRGREAIANELNWNVEKNRLLSLYSELIEGTSEKNE